MRTLQGLLLVRGVLRFLTFIVLGIVALGALSVLVAESWVCVSSANSCYDTPQECKSDNAVGLASLPL